jgi:hypothetical protein
MTSVNTNAGAILAQKFLRSTASDMQVTQNRVSSGLRVSNVTDDASSFAVAAGIRGHIKAYTAVAAALQCRARNIHQTANPPLRHASAHRVRHSLPAGLHAHHFCGDFLHNIDLEIALGNQLLQPRVLLFELFRTPHVVGLEHPEPLAPCI